MKCRELTRLHRKSGLVERIEPKKRDLFTLLLPPASAPAKPGTLSQRRLLRDAQAASVLNQANICTVYDIEEQGGPRRRRRSMRGCRRSGCM